MPGTKWKRSLKNPELYEELKSEGKSKRDAARISNGLAKKGKVPTTNRHSPKGKKK